MAFADKLNNTNDSQPNIQKVSLSQRGSGVHGIRYSGKYCEMSDGGAALYDSSLRNTLESRPDANVKT